VSSSQHHPALSATAAGAADCAHDFSVAEAFSGGKNDIGPPHVFLQRAAIRGDRIKPMTVCSCDDDDNSYS